VVLKLGEEVVKLVENRVNREFEGADELDDVTSGVRGKALLKLIDTVGVGVVRKTGDTIEIVAPETMLGGILNNMPLNQILGIIVLHVLLIAAAKEVDDLVAGKQEHGSA